MLTVSGVRDAVAIVAGDCDHRRLIGYVTGAVDGGEVKRSLDQILPAHMVPFAVIVIEALPLVLNGKVDLSRLPQPTTVAGDQMPPRTQIEERLSGLWKTALKLDDIDRMADFFELGGDSLLALRLIARVEEEFGYRIGLGALFKAPTIADFARVIADTSAHDFDFRQVVRLYPQSS